MPNEILRSLADNPALMNALRELFAKKFSLENVPIDNPELSNALLGEVVRARIEGMAIVTDTFKEIERLKSFDRREPKENPAR